MGQPCKCTFNKYYRMFCSVLLEHVSQFDSIAQQDISISLCTGSYSLLYMWTMDQKILFFLIHSAIKASIALVFPLCALKRVVPRTYRVKR